MSDRDRDCPICERAAGAADPPGGWVLRDGPWAVGIFEGFEVPGWVFVELHGRHTEGPWSLTASESTSLGPVLTRVSGAIRKVCDAERVYWLAFGELFPHFHVLLCPRLADAPGDERGPALFGAREQLRDPDAAVTVAGRLRAELEA